VWKGRGGRGGGGWGGWGGCGRTGAVTKKAARLDRISQEGKRSTGKRRSIRGVQTGPSETASEETTLGKKSVYAKLKVNKFRDKAQKKKRDPKSKGPASLKMGGGPRKNAAKKMVRNTERNVWGRKPA